MKAGLVAARELTDVARETALMQENSAKVVITVCKLIIYTWTIGLDIIPALCTCTCIKAKDPK